ncbi:hypothetical protein CERSUDRAFT_78723, partial [Gelatoporia subvermispora B]
MSTRAEKGTNADTRPSAGTLESTPDTPQADSVVGSTTAISSAAPASSAHDSVNGKTMSTSVDNGMAGSTTTASSSATPASSTHDSVDGKTNTFADKQINADAAPSVCTSDPTTERVGLSAGDTAVADGKETSPLSAGPQETITSPGNKESRAETPQQRRRKKRKQKRPGLRHAHSEYAQQVRVRGKKIHWQYDRGAGCRPRHQGVNPLTPMDGCICPKARPNTNPNNFDAPKGRNLRAPRCRTRRKRKETNDVVQVRTLRENTQYCAGLHTAERREMVMIPDQRSPSPAQRIEIERIRALDMQELADLREARERSRAEARLCTGQSEGEDTTDTTDTAHPPYPPYATHPRTGTPQTPQTPRSQRGAGRIASAPGPAKVMDSGRSPAVGRAIGNRASSPIE